MPYAYVDVSSAYRQIYRRRIDTGTLPDAYQTRTEPRSIEIPSAQEPPARGVSAPKPCPLRIETVLINLEAGKRTPLEQKLQRQFWCSSAIAFFKPNQPDGAHDNAFVSDIL
ncbi:unnamed protein product [Didymodactylos carnosus]|uniref:Uncharacterized protein n=1 Tax=Didymodactylos carnosus TaxID=1234261 RepID=A0A814SG82_9BILA|nr:unnamed protein product [Didymodactylos carnosus]CAF3909188.1 unnamed protein product [Didymodactylos carnosus]